MTQNARQTRWCPAIGALVLVLLVGCHRKHDEHKQLGLVTEDAVATFRAVCGVEPKREEGVLDLYNYVGDVLRGRDVVRLTCRHLTRDRWRAGLRSGDSSHALGEL